MATIKELQEKIAKLEKGINSKATNPNAKAKARLLVKKFKSDIADLKAKAKSKPTTSKVSKAKEISKEMKRKYSKSRPFGKSDIYQDAVRPAKRIGKRTSAEGNTYYEYRENRTDRKQPPKRYPRLEDGGMTDYSKIVLKYDFPKYKRRPQVTQYFVVDVSKEILVGGMNEKGFKLNFKENNKDSNLVISERELENLMEGNNITSSGANVTIFSKYADGGALQNKIDHIIENYDGIGVMAFERNSNKGIQVGSEYYQIINEINNKEFNGRGVIKNIGKESSYYLLSINEDKMADGGRLSVAKKYSSVSEYMEYAKKGDLVLVGKNEDVLKYASDSYLDRFIEVKDGEAIFKQFGRKGLISYPNHYSVILVNRKYEDGGSIDLLSDTSGAGLQNVGGTSFSNVDLTPQMDITNPMFANGGETHRGEGGMYAQGGLLQHGLRIGDKVIDKFASATTRSNKIVVVNDGKKYVVDLNIGLRTSWNDFSKMVQNQM